MVLPFTARALARTGVIPTLRLVQEMPPFDDLKKLPPYKAVYMSLPLNAISLIFKRLLLEVKPLLKGVQLAPLLAERKMPWLRVPAYRKPPLAARTLTSSVRPLFK